MLIIDLKKLNKFLLPCVLSIFLLVLTTPLAWGWGTTGASGEPGGSCPLSETGYKYITPPYTGTFTAYFHDSGLYITGLVERVGNSTEVGNIPAPGVLLTTMTLSEFQNLTPNEIRGYCLVGFESFFGIDSGFFDVVGVGKIRYTSETSFTADVVIMQVQTR